MTWIYSILIVFGFLCLIAGALMGFSGAAWVLFMFWLGALVCYVHNAIFDR